MDSEAQDLDWDWLKGEILAFFASDANHVDKIEMVRKYRREAYEKGFTSEQVSKSVHRLRIRLDEDKQHKQAEPPPPPESKPTLLEGSTERTQDRGATTGNVGLPYDSRPSKPVAPREDIGKTGTKLRQPGRPSILDMADAKRKAPN